MAAPEISVLTALADRAEHRLAEVHATLTAVPVSWEWLIQHDGEGLPSVPEAIAADPRAVIESNRRRLGIAATRNRALGRARAPLLLNADADDVPEPAALTALPGAFADPTVGLAFGDWIERWPDREPWSPQPRFAPGRLAAGHLSAIWASERWVPMHLAGAMWRTEAVLAAGGWTATVGGSDIGLLIGVDAAWASVYVPQLTFTYHHHATQATASAAWQRQFDTDVRFLARRQAALAALSDGPPGQTRAGAARRPD
ncbi:MAG TPA: glycosyltransferase family 2 protein [Solirubrobacteraceae bacterium]|nr:glycosyltransferase family 2 protein [Solirubrobacteraceae bacterium]